MPLAGINGYSISPHAHIEGGQFYSSNAEHSNYLLVQFQSPLDHERYEEIHTLSLHTLEYLGENTYRCQYEPEDLQQIRTLPFVIYANVYHPAYVIQPSLKTKINTSLADYETEPGRLYHVSVVLHSENEGEHGKSMLADLLRVEKHLLEADWKCIHAHLTAQQIDAAAALDQVLAIEEILPLSYQLFQARQDIHLPRARLFGSVPYRGQGQVIAIADQGIDGGRYIINKGRSDAEVKGDGNDHPAFSGRILDRIAENRKAADYTGLTPDKDTLLRLTTRDSISSHGTHVSGCALGNGNASPYGQVQGAAPAASLVMFSISSERGVPFIENLTALLKRAYHHLRAPRIINFSQAPMNWQDKPAVYNATLAATADAFVWANQDILIVASAGNFGAKTPAPYGQISGMGLAKNVLTVGACQTSHSLAWGVGLDKQNRHLQYRRKGPRGNPDTMAYFSSRGPAYTGTGAADTAPFRWKPDVVAPGTAILSAKARGSTGPGDGSKFGTSANNDYVFDSGTSFAAPIVAGVAALLRQAVMTRRGREGRVTAALIKALMVNTTDDIQTKLPAASPIPYVAGAPAPFGPDPLPGRAPAPVLPVDPSGSTDSDDSDDPGVPPPAFLSDPKVNAAPDATQGFGRINAERALTNVTDTTNCWFLDDVPCSFVATAPWSRTVNIPPKPAGARGWKLSVTMSYTDLPGATLQNVLELSITYTMISSTGGHTAVTRYGNDMAVQGELPRPSEQPDTNNTVQKIVWNLVPAGQNVRIAVTCTRFTIIPTPLGTLTPTFAIVSMLERV
ncbi:peptidase S8/S53 domain-containing protein [Exophiala viscosa]|uniref:peptidase S8/S53 domain-containing protein n=1 Tax=Exophiala viscosa TaxID=2486360 RepID=UPI0021A016F2|nr:peptidase S8/S53 domain-containing protein [Exophiala viscosa]